MRRRLFLFLFPLLFISFTIMNTPFQTKFTQTDKYGNTFKGKIYYDGSKIMMVAEYPDTQYFLMDSVSYAMYLPQEKTIYQWNRKNYIYGVIKVDTTVIKCEKREGYYCGLPKINIGIDSFYVWKKENKIDSMRIFTPDTNVYRFVFSKWKNGKIDSEKMKFPVNYDSVKVIKE